jgi:hypothetical protein
VVLLVAGQDGVGDEPALWIPRHHPRHRGVPRSALAHLYMGQNQIQESHHTQEQLPEPGSTLTCMEDLQQQGLETNPQSLWQHNYLFTDIQSSR